MGNLIENANPKKNPMTSWPGVLFIFISAVMFVVKYIMPVFIILKQEVPYDWWAPTVPLAIGILLVFINDDYFSRIFNRADKIAGKKTDTN